MASFDAASTTPSRNTSTSPPRSVSQFDFGDGEENAQQLPPVDGGKAAWLFIAASTILETFIWGYSFCFATTLVYLENHPPWNRYSVSQLSAVGTTQLGLEYIFPVVAVTVYRRYPEWVRTILWTSVVISCGSMLLSSWATELWQLIVLQGVLCGISNTLIYSPVFVYLTDWWSARRGMALGVVFAGGGLGGFIFPWLINVVLETKGFPWLCRIWALMTAVVFSVSIVFIKPRVPIGRPAGGRAPWFPVGGWKFAKNPLFLLSMLCAGFGGLAYLPVANYLAVYAHSFSSSTTTVNLVVGLFNLAASVGCFIAGALCDRSYALANALSGGLCALVSLTAWGLADTLGKVYLFAVLFGLVGQQSATWGAATRDLAAGNPHLGTLIITLISVMKGVTSLFMPAVSEALYKRSAVEKEPTWGRYGFGNIIIFVGVCSIALLACSAAILPLRKLFVVDDAAEKPQMERGRRQSFREE
ncbi:hypothetical protein JCM8208_006618 [Rhodotorula glutinis]